MCGIVGYCGHRDATKVLLAGLHRLEYRGYDSAGIALQTGQGFLTIKKQGKVAAMEAALPKGATGTVGIGHTRWATHGEPSDLNAHPHHDSTGRLALVHNGIIENHAALRQLLEQDGRKLQTATDTEVLVEYISFVQAQDSLPLADAVRLALGQVVGAYGIVVMSSDEPDQLVVARLGSPLVLGVGDGEMLVASDAGPIVEYTRKIIYLGEGELAVVTPDHYSVVDIAGNAPVATTIQEVDLTLEAIEKGGYPHFMLKEIMQQSQTIADAMRGRVDFEAGQITLGGLRDWIDRLLEADRLYLTACGTSWHSALIIGDYLEELAGLSTKVDYASELRYRETTMGGKSVVGAISQSGETADTLAAIRKANEQGALTFGIVNAVGSSIARETDCGVFIHAGPEIGVASTKAFTSQVLVGLLIAILLAQRRGRSPEKVGAVLGDLERLPGLVDEVLDASADILALAGAYADSSNFLYLGRGYQFPVALEGALKLKEISYIHAEGYPAAEMKHGPIALIDEHMPVVVLALKGRTYDKVLANMQEIKARHGRIIAVVSESDGELDALADHIIKVPAVHPLVQPLLTAIPLQLLAYHIAVLRDCSVDQPRNLAKSVTVE
jgi:glucosamine--fructose-6-phosphate aminotransferase (isomerizing)